MVKFPKFYSLLTNRARSDDFTDDEQILGVHLGQGMTKQADFNVYFKFYFKAYYYYG